MFSACLFYLAYAGVSLKNEKLCLEFTHLGGYYFILVVVLISEVVRLVKIIIGLSHGRIIYFLSLMLSLIFIALEVAAIYHVRLLLNLVSKTEPSSDLSTPNNIESVDPSSGQDISHDGNDVL